MADDSLYDPALWRKLEENAIPEPNSGCLLWLCGAIPEGYGSLRFNGRQHGTHRLAWLATRGPIPSGMCVCHRCDVRLCISPNHLFLGTKAANTADMLAKHRNKAGRGHPGSRNGFAKLTEAQVRAIRVAIGTQYEIAERFGITQAAVWLILHRKTWTHVA